MKPLVAFLSQGRLFLIDERGEKKLVESAYAENTVETAQQISQRNAWKKSDMLRAMGMDDSMAGQMAMEGRAFVQFTGVTAGWNSEEITYLLRTESVGGLFSYNTSSSEERRLFHKEHFHAEDLARDPKTGLIACSVGEEWGARNLVLTDEEGTDRREITSGDSADGAPSWVPGGELVLVFHSSGIARDSQGHFAGFGPSAIERLEVQSGRMETLASEEGKDLIVPRVASDGSLYYIRRPYSAMQTATWKTFALFAWSLITLPFRVIAGIVMLADRLTKLNSAKPMMAAPGAGQRRPTPEQESMLVRGAWIKMTNPARALKDDEDRPLVPASWELIKQDKAGEKKVVATGVIDFDLIPGGGLVYTTGTAVWKLDESGKRTRLARHKPITAVTWLG